MKREVRNRIKRVVDWRQSFQWEEWICKGSIRMKQTVNYYKGKPDSKPREGMKGQQQDGLLKVVE